MKRFLDENFLLNTRTAELLYHDYAEGMPILDYHNHLPPDEIAQDKTFENITQAWLKGDHYKWRAMRANGIEERYITGDATDYEKFEKWAQTVPHTFRNPLYHWTCLELKNPFGIKDLLTPVTAQAIYGQTSEKLRADFPVRKLLTHFKVKILCTTDDPVEGLGFHRQIQKENWAVKVFPTFRPDKAMAIENGPTFNGYLDSLQRVADVEVNSWQNFLAAIRRRHDFFASVGCKLSDHGLETFYAEDFTDQEIATIFSKARSGRSLEQRDILQFKSACLVEFAKLDAEKNWAQQFHIGAIRNNSTRLLQRLGGDSGADSTGDFQVARSMAKFFDTLDKQNSLPKTIVYNLNPAYNDVFATMIANFNDGSVAGKMQYGSAWWFLDQKDGIESQLKTLSNTGLLSRFVGMLTDSRSFLSFSRHEYFRRILCNLIGLDVENGELPNDLAWLGQSVQDICYRNAERYFQF